MTAPPGARPVLGASAAVFRRLPASPASAARPRAAWHVLLATRVAAPYSGVWTLPGGRVEFGETVADAAAREVREEVGVEAEILGLARLVEITGSGGHFVVAAHAALWRSGEPRPGPEAGEVAWVEPARIGARATTPELETTVKAALALLRRSRVA